MTEKNVDDVINFGSDDNLSTPSSPQSNRNEKAVGSGSKPLLLSLSDALFVNVGLRSIETVKKCSLAPTPPKPVTAKKPVEASPPNVPGIDSVNAAHAAPVAVKDQLAQPAAFKIPKLIDVRANAAKNAAQAGGKRNAVAVGRICDLIAECN